MNEGSANVKATFDKNFYYSGETAIIRLVIDNTLCKKALKSIRVTLMRELEYEKKANKLKNFRNIMNEIVIGGVVPNSLEEKTVELLISEG